MKILIWGFYNQGNLGDDLMALMFSEIVRELGHSAVILSKNPRFSALGYDTISNLKDFKSDAIILAGGAFFKAAQSSNNSIESEIKDLADYIEKTSTPVFGISLGSDGACSIDEISHNRKRVINSDSFFGAIVRLQKDLKILSDKSIYLPDIVFTTKFFCESRGFLSDIKKSSDRILLNLSKRSITRTPLAFLTHTKNKKVSFLAHGGAVRTGGELCIPFTEKYIADDIYDSINYIGTSNGIFSSKLHPGIIALSYGKNFYATAMRAKTRDFVQEYSEAGIITVKSKIGHSHITSCIESQWQADLWESYKKSLNSFFQKINSK